MKLKLLERLTASLRTKHLVHCITNLIKLFAVLLLFYLIFIIFVSFSSDAKKYFSKRETKVNPYLHKAVISGSTICESRPDIMVIVKSHYMNYAKRTAIRSTWGSHVQQGKWLFGQKLDSNIKVAFLLGLTQSNAHELALKQEAQDYGDIIQADFVDSHRNLTLKSLFALKWMTEHCPVAKYLLKCDDDTIINFPVILDHIQTGPSTNTIWGPLMHHSKTIRFGKYSMCWSDYPFIYLPPYLKGIAYLITADVIEPLFTTAEYVPRVPIDDVYLTGILVKILNIDLYDKDTVKWDQFYSTPCDFMTNRTISSVYDDAISILDVWQKMSEKPDC